MKRTFAAVDIGASGGRVVAGTVDGGHIALEDAHRFPNGVTEREGHLRWDLGRLLREVHTGLARVPGAESIGIDTWGVDYGLLDGSGRLLADPIAYRDDRTTKLVDDVHALVSPAELYAVTGIQFLPFNTIYQLAADRRGPQWRRVRRVVLLPDLFAHLLTGELRTELTNASTTALLDARTRNWSTELLDRLGVASHLLPPIEQPGAARGRTGSGQAVTTVASHDTASAVVGIPATTDHFAYVASGTWSLVGVEIDRPVLSEEARRANFTNEAGVDGRTRLLRNVGGLWLLQECLRQWRRDLEQLLAAAARVTPGGPSIDVDDPMFIAPGDMPDRIIQAVGTALTIEETVRCILDSLAAAYARTVHQAAQLAGTTVDVIHIVGGGSRNRLLCQLTADAARLPVAAGPVEATALGNVVVQARARGALPASLEAIRAVIASSFAPRWYEPT